MPIYQIFPKLGQTGESGYSGYSGIGDRYSTTSNSILSIGIGTQTLTANSGLAYSIGQSAIVAFDNNNKMEGTISSYNTNTGDLIIDIGSNDGTFLSFFNNEAVYLVLCIILTMITNLIWI